MKSKRRVVYVPPAREELQDIARRACEQMRCPQYAFELADFLQIVDKIKAEALNRQTGEG